MAERSGKKKGVFLVASVLLAAVFVGAFGREYLREKEIEHDIATLEGENSRLEGKRLEFLDLIDRLSSEYYLEGQARTKEGLAKPGETLLVVDTGKPATLPNGAVLGAKDSLEGISNPARWLYYFFDHGRFDQLSGL
ncbi:MAG: septum formation initiator family protein [Patescibacteria group bacterium]|jgi:cell division protein FtsB